MSKKHWPHLLVACLVSVVLLAAMSAGIFRLQREKLIDLLFTPQSSVGDVVIVAIDDASIRAIGQWPWPRAVFGTLVKNLDGAAIVAVDVNFKEASRLGSADDAAFASAVKSIQAPVVLNAEIDDRGQYQTPIPVLAAVSQQGFPNLIVDSDGTARRISVVHNGFKSLSLKVAELFRSPVVVPSQQPFRIAYRAPAESLPHVLALDVFSGKIPKQFFEHKIVFIGSTASDLQDFHLTPFGRMSGVEIQANIAQALIDGRFFNQQESGNWVLVLLVSFVTIWLCIRLKKISHLVGALVGLAFLYVLIAFWAFGHMYILDLLYPLLVLIITSVLTILIQYFSTAKEKKFIQDTFSRYLAPQVVDKLIADSSQLKLGGEKREISVLFSDIRGFTSFAEHMQPQELSHFLNSYLTCMTNIVLDRAGVIDKYIGDAIMAFWGAPLDDKKHAFDSVMVALDMISILQDFNKENSGVSVPMINIGIGINSGEATVGNMGSEKRFDYTAIGDNVNLASRLEGLNKFYGTNIIVSQATYDMAGVEDSAITFREIDRVRVKGRREAVRIFEVVPRHLQAEVSSVMSEFQQALTAYYAGNWQTAIQGFTTIIQKLSDGPSLALVTRCRMLADRGSDAVWEGIWELTDK